MMGGRLVEGGGDNWQICMDQGSLGAAGSRPDACPSIPGHGCESLQGSDVCEKFIDARGPPFHQCIERKDFNPFTSKCKANSDECLMGANNNLCPNVRK